VPLVTIGEVADLLACPRCGSPLLRSSGSGLRCTKDGCGPSGTATFPVLADRWPVLIDFERSILAPEQVTPPQPAPRSPRGAALARRRIRELVRPVNQVAARNVSTLDRLLDGDAPLVLVVGGGSIGNGVDSLYDSERLRLLAFDIVASEHVQLIADAHQIPLISGCVDAVIVQAVLEHVLNPWQVVEEVHRVLKPDGLVYAETPFMQQVHAGPYDFTRFTDSGHRWLFRRFDEIDRGVVAGPGTALSWSIDHAGRSMARSRTVGRLLRITLFWVRFLDRFSGASFATDGACALFFLGRRSETALGPRAILTEYAGGQ
jgi:SAM-dependent methyltransferase